MDLSKHESWFYNSCPNCPRRISVEGAKFYCGRCLAHVDNYTQRYRVNVIVRDSSGKTTFTLFNKEVERLIGVPILKVISEIGQDKISNEIPPVLSNMLGRKCLFEVKANSYNKPGRDGYTVTRSLKPPQKLPQMSLLQLMRQALPRMSLLPLMSRPLPKNNESLKYPN